MGCPLCDLSGGGDEVRRNDASADRLVRRRRGGGQRKKNKKPFGALFVCFAPSTAKTHLGLVFQPDVAVLEQPVEVVRAHGFRFPLVRVVHEVLYAAHRRDGAHDDGERREGLERLRLVSRDDGATARREGMCGQRGAGGASGSYAATRAMRACARRRGISLVGSSSLKAFRPTAVEGIVVRPGGAYHVRFCFGARDAAGLLARGATLRSEREGRGTANGAITGRRGTSATLRASE